MARNSCVNAASVRNALFGALVVTAAGWGPAVAEETTADFQHLRPLINQTLETEKSGIEIGWSNPATGHAGTLRVERTFYRDQQPCREYVRTVERAGAATLVSRGIGCRVARAQWDIQEESATVRAPSPGPPAAPAAEDREPAKTSAEDPAAARACPDPAELASAGTDQPTPAPFAAFTLPARSDI